MPPGPLVLADLVRASDGVALENTVEVDGDGVVLPLSAVVAVALAVLETEPASMSPWVTV